MKLIQVIHNDQVYQVSEDDITSFSFDAATAHFAWKGNTLFLCQEGEQFEFKVLTEDEARRERLLKAAGAGSGVIKAPMPGKVLQVLVNEGDSVQVSQPLVVVEAMKMQNEYQAGIDGVVKKVHVKEGDTVEAGVVLVEIN